MSASQHPVAMRLQAFGDSDASLLALVMGLPLIDGIFPALVLSGALDDPFSAIQVGLLIFGGSATVAVILAEMDGDPRAQIRVVLTVGVPLILLAATQAAVAPAIESVLDLGIFKRFAALVVAAIAAKTASATVGEYLPSPGVIVGLGLVASLDPAGARLAVLTDPWLVVNATLAAVVGVSFALALAAFGPHLRSHVDIDRFRFGCALALGLLPLSLLGVAFGQAPLAVLVVAALFAFDPDGDETTSQRSPTATAPAVHRADGGQREAIADGDDSDAETSDDRPTAYGRYSGDADVDGTERAPWL
ncbi:DUF5794 domain-containing protein [Halovivax limisalsi]|uniref:DUF5794 domain-containing protein n=1 Tax=Halovivax limisalsi TaxID=1453760 RepID=UPI001FFCAB3C|nr:DUF5794 domain-containing protein [Halovivax limisalsi]